LVTRFLTQAGALSVVQCRHGARHQGTRGKIAASIHDPEIPSAQHAAHVQGINKMRVCRTPAVRTSLGHHPTPPCEARLLYGPPNLYPGLTVARIPMSPDAHFQQQDIGFISKSRMGIEEERQKTNQQS
jgi:hypothetical protein